MRANTFLGLTAAVGGMAIVAAAFSTPASAATATTNLGVSATVTNNCTISTAALAFGSYDPVVTHAATNLDGTGTVTVACTKGVAPTVGLGLGSNASGSTRRMPRYQITVARPRHQTNGGSPWASSRLRLTFTEVSCRVVPM